MTAIIYPFPGKACRPGTAEDNDLADLSRFTLNLALHSGASQPTAEHLAEWAVAQWRRLVSEMAVTLRLPDPDDQAMLERVHAQIRDQYARVVQEMFIEMVVMELDRYQLKAAADAARSRPLDR